MTLLGLAMTRKRGKISDPGGTSPNERTAPEWMDERGEHGQLTVLLMSPAHHEGKLPSNPFIVARSVKEHVGSISAAYRDKNDHLVIKVRSEKKAAKLLELVKLIDGTEVKVTEHERLNQTKCIVTCHSVNELSEEELVEELADQGVIHVRRLGRQGGKSATMVVTFRGTVAPREVFFGFDRCSTREYRQAPMQCFRCFSFGHTKSRCTAEELCRNCSKAHPIQKDENGRTICEAAARCKNCNGAHSPTSRTCPKYLEEETINEIRTKEDKSAREARRLFEERKATASGPSYAGVAGSGNSDARQNEILKKELEQSKGLLQKALSEIANLKKTEAAQRKQDQATQRALEKALQQIAEMKAAQATDPPNGNKSDESDEDDSDMEIVEEDGKRRRPESSNSDSSGSGDESEDSQKNAPVAITKTGGDPPKPKTQPTKPPNDTTPQTKPTNKTNKKSNKKIKTGSGQVDSAPNNKPKRKQ